MRYHRIVLGALLLALLQAWPAGAQTAPDPTQEGIWVLRFENDRPESVWVEDTPDSEPWWFMTYRIMNDDATPHRFQLTVEAESDGGYVYHDVSDPLALAAIRSQRGLRPEDALSTCYELAIPPTPTVPPTRLEPVTLNWPVIAGHETKNCVAVFRGFDPHMDRLTIRVVGLTNDVQMATTGVPNEREVTERVLVLTYERPGDEFYTSLDRLVFQGREWVTEVTTILTDLR